MAEPSPPRTILVVDDQTDFQELLDLHLSGCGFEVITAKDGLQAADIIVSRPVDVVLTDLEMPNLDGIGLLRLIRARALLTRTIVVTGKASLSTLTACLQEGATGLLRKPIRMDQLDRAVDLACQQLAAWDEQVRAIRSR